MKVFNVEIILERMKEIANCKNDTQLAKILELPRSSISNMKKRMQIPGDVIINFSLKYNITFRYLLFGEQRYSEGLRKLVELIKDSPEDIEFLTQLMIGRKTVKDALLKYGEAVLTEEDCGKFQKKVSEKLQQKMVEKG